MKSFYVQENYVWLVDQSDPETRLYLGLEDGDHLITRDQRFDQVEHFGKIVSYLDVYTPETDRNLEPFLPNFGAETGHVYLNEGLTIN